MRVIGFCPPTSAGWRCGGNALSMAVEEIAYSYHVFFKGRGPQIRPLRIPQGNNLVGASVLVAHFPLLIFHGPSTHTVPHRIPIICKFIWFDRIMGCNGKGKGFCKYHFFSPMAVVRQESLLPVYCLAPPLFKPFANPLREFKLGVCEWL